MCGRRRRISERAIRDSGSDRGCGPEYCGSPGYSRCRQRQGKLRFRSTPRSFCRVPSATPSGFRSGIVTIRPDRGGGSLPRSRAMAMPAGSSPWIAPTTRSGRAASGSPSRRATIGRPRTEVPRMSFSRTGTSPLGRPAAVRVRTLCSAPPPGWDGQDANARHDAVSARPTRRSDRYLFARAEPIGLCLD
jgi:hypothetical protein